MTARRIERICCGSPSTALMSGESWKLELEELPEEVGDVADLAVLEHGGELRAHLGLGGLGVHAFDDAEPGPQDAREDLVRGPPSRAAPR